MIYSHTFLCRVFISTPPNSPQPVFTKNHSYQTHYLIQTILTHPNTLYIKIQFIKLISIQTICRMRRETVITHPERESEREREREISQIDEVRGVTTIDFTKNRRRILPHVRTYVCSVGRSPPDSSRTLWTTGHPIEQARSVIGNKDIWYTTHIYDRI